MFKGSLETILRIKVTGQQAPIYQLGLTSRQSSYFAAEDDPAAGIYNCIILNLQKDSGPSSVTKIFVRSEQPWRVDTYASPNKTAMGATR